MRKIIKTSLFLILLLISNNSFAMCRCVCINRQVVQMCDSNFDFAANCTLKSC